MKKTKNQAIAVLDIFAIIAIILYVAVDNDIVGGICLLVWGVALIAEIADRVIRKKHS